MRKKNNSSWITLPIKKCPQDTLIKDIEFTHNPLWHQKLLTTLSEINGSTLDQSLAGSLLPQGDVVEYLTNHLQSNCQALGLPFSIQRSSELNIPAKDAKLIFINNIRKEHDTLLQDGDRLGIFPPVGGG